MFDKAHKQFVSDAKVAFNTEAGLRVLAYLKELHIKTSCLEDSSDKTHYRLGQRELVQSLLNTLSTDVEELVDSINYTD
jgi:hypothetical protein